MHEWMLEFLMVLSRSTMTQVALLLAITAPLGLYLLGLSQVGQIEFHGPLALLTAPVRELLMLRYDKAAWLAFGTFLLAALKFYKRDRRRYYGL